MVSLRTRNFLNKKDILATFVFGLVTAIARPAFSASHNAQLALTPSWLKILHMKPDGVGQWKSEITSPKFFLSPNGRTNPSAELDATIAVFSQAYKGSPDLDPKCLFPARLKLISQLTGWKGIAPNCPALNQWKAEIKAQSVTIVHAAQYISNPASMFGHLFIRFDVASSDQTELRLDTLAHSVGFFAQMPPDVGAFDYVVKGLGGGFEGHYLFSTYARSLVEYNQIEDRDLWEYELKLTKEEIDQIVNHLWEMRNFGIFAYYFLLKNCAYQLLALLEGAVPKWDLTDPFDLYLIPSDALRKLQDEGAIQKVHYRPSLGTKLRRTIKNLSNDQQTQLWKIIEGNPSALTKAEIAVLDAAIDLIDYRTHQSKGLVPSNFVDIKRSSLNRRAQLAVAAQPQYQIGLPPHTAHGPGKLSFNYLRHTNIDGLLLGWRPAMHRVTDGGGYPSGLSLEILDLKAVIEPTARQIYLDQITVLRAENLREFEAIDQALAWRFKIGWERSIFQTEKMRNMIFAANFGFGLASAPGRSLQFFTLLSVPMEFSGEFRGGGQTGLGIVAGSTISIFDDLIGRTEFSMDYLVVPQRTIRRKFCGEISYHLARDWAIEGRLQGNNETRRYELGLSQFF